MNTLPGWAGLLVIIGILFISGVVANWLPLSTGWTALAAGGIAGILGFMLDQWGKRRDHRSG